MESAFLGNTGNFSQVVYNRFHRCVERAYVMKRRILFLLAVVMAAAFLLSGCGQNKGYIDFSKPQEAPVVEEQGEHPLRIAFAAVMSPKETRQSYQAVVDYIAGQLGEPVVLVQRRTYEELNGLVANGDADIAFYRQARIRHTVEKSQSNCWPWSRRMVPLCTIRMLSFLLIVI